MRIKPMDNKRIRGVANLENKETREVVVDRLSDLPDSVILKIMSLIPIKEAVRTCILSKRWKEVFTHISDIDLDGRLKNEILRDSFMTFVDGFLLSRHRDTCVHRFRLDCGRGMDLGRIFVWIQYALRNGVTDLDLCIQTRPVSVRKFGVFSCKRLETLRLCMLPRFILSVPTNCHLPNLKVLRLGNLKFSDDESIQRLISSCKSLEELVVDSCDLSNINKLSVCHPKLKRLTIIDHCEYTSYYEVEINTPNLVYLMYLYYKATRYSIKNLNSLSEACIHNGGNVNSYHSARDITPAIDLMRGISHVRTLNLSGSQLKTIQQSPHLILQFPNLTYLNMGRWYDAGWAKMLAICPYLETFALDIRRDWPIGVPDISPEDWHITEEVPFCLVHHIKEIQLFSFTGNEVEYQLVEYLLEKAKVLESLTVKSVLCGNKRVKQKMSKKLCALPKVSNKCRVLLI